MRNRWLIALSAVGIHISIGSVYAFSVLVKPIMEVLGASMADVTWTFSLAILFLGMSAGLLGRTVEKMGPKKSGCLAAILFGTGMIGTAYAISVRSLSLLYLFYGVIGGIGLGTGYITPVSTLVKYFPNHRGFATGLAIMGFGFAALIAAPLMQYLYAVYGLSATFRYMGIAYFLIMVSCALYLKPPAANVSQEGKNLFLTGFTANEAMRTWQFAALWWVFFINITCGIGLLAVLSPMAQQVIGMSPAEAAAFVGIIGIMNGGGRIVWSTISDKIGRPVTYILFFVLEIGAFLLLAGTNAPDMFKFLVLLIISCYGGGFSCMPAYLSDLFGTKQLSAIHGRVLTAWGIAGIVGPTLVSWFYRNTGTYFTILIFFAILFIPNAIIAIILKYKGKQLAEPVAAD
jgi:OFA family oxalate/formate antiporter-like MFS transporter